MDYEKCVCPVLNVDGKIACGKQYDLDITLPEDNRTVVYGIVKNCYQEPVCDAVVKLVEVVCECGKEERRPVSHTFTDKNGEFVFGPLCANRLYEVEIWVDNVKHCKVCASCKHDGDCLKGVKLDCDKHHQKPCDRPYEKPCDKPYDRPYEKQCEKPCEKQCDCHEEKPYEKPCDKQCEKPCDKPCDKD